jgi:hypothetical protein
MEENEEILVPCIHCNGRINLAIEEHCPKCDISIFISPDEAFKTLLLPYDIEKASEITRIGKEYLKQLLDLLSTKDIPKLSWTDKPEPKTSLEIEISRVKNKLSWAEIFERYTTEVPDWKTNTQLRLTEWLIKNYNKPTIIK